MEKQLTQPIETPESDVVELTLEQIEDVAGARKYVWAV
jgi:hypothetical protein